MNAEVEKHIRRSNPEGLLAYLNSHAESVQTRLTHANSDYSREIETALYKKWKAWEEWVKGKLYVKEKSMENSYGNSENQQKNNCK